MTAIDIQHDAHKLAGAQIIANPATEEWAQFSPDSFQISINSPDHYETALREQSNRNKSQLTESMKDADSLFGVYEVH